MSRRELDVVNRGDLLVPIGQDQFFDERYPVWECPGCGQVNRYLNTFFELCQSCGTDHTLDWEQFAITEESLDEGNSEVLQ